MTNNLHVDLERNETEQFDKGEVRGRTAFRLMVRRTGEPTRGVWTIQRDGENDADTIDRLVTYHSQHPDDKMPIAEDNKPLTEI
jgi:hypothetical protein